MVQEGFKRKLTAIMSADVAGYSRLMAEDEASTVKILADYREVIASLSKQHHGRVVDSPGDNILAEFASVADAVQCAVAVQKELEKRNADLDEGRRMEFRIGINLGDVIDKKSGFMGMGSTLLPGWRQYQSLGAFAYPKPLLIRSKPSSSSFS